MTAYNGLKAYKTLHPAPLNLKAVGNVSDPVAELRRLSGLRVMSQGIVALIPTIEFKTVDQFDFLTVGSLLVPNPLIEGSIETITLTWNFSKALDTTKKRRDLFKAIAAHKELFKKEQKKILPEKPSKPMQFCMGDYLYLQFSAQSTHKDLRWSASDLPEGLVMQRNGLLRGHFEKKGENEFLIRVEDERGTEAISEKRRIDVKSCDGKRAP